MLIDPATSVAPSRATLPAGGTDASHGAGAPLRARPDRPLTFRALGTVDYQVGWAQQRALVAAHAAEPEATPDTVLLLEHPAVYTLGRRAERSHVLLAPDELERRGIEVVEVDRGGDVTYHGPGQLVAYPILRLARARGVVDYVRALESVVIVALDALGVRATRMGGLTGVWVEGEKVAAIGVRVGAGGITSHGLALNVAPDLADFDGIVPCGIADRGVTSLARLGLDVDLATAATHLASAFTKVFVTDPEKRP
jgi:lipoyl(octanoyl) transferase